MISREEKLEYLRSEYKNKTIDDVREMINHELNKVLQPQVVVPDWLCVNSPAYDNRPVILPIWMAKQISKMLAKYIETKTPFKAEEMDLANDLNLAIKDVENGK